MNFKETIENVSMLLDAGQKVCDDCRNIEGIVAGYKSNKEYRNSQEWQEEIRQIKKYARIATILESIYLLLWLAMIVGTIALCCTGNDVVLRFFHI
ncbi:MAG: hypothetical protein MSA09_16445 [Lachnospiraceae bacterium]|nr:hypothetical protein [Lachnospiraceae bacterium]